MGKTRIALYMDMSTDKDPERVRQVFVTAAQKIGLDIHFANVKVKKKARQTDSQTELYGILSRAKEPLTLQQVHDRRQEQVSRSTTFKTLARMIEHGQVQKSYIGDGVKYSLPASR